MRGAPRRSIQGTGAAQPPASGYALLRLDAPCWTRTRQASHTHRHTVPARNGQRQRLSRGVPRPWGHGLSTAGDARTPPPGSGASTSIAGARSSESRDAGRMEDGCNAVRRPPGHGGSKSQGTRDITARLDGHDRSHASPRVSPRVRCNGRRLWIPHQLVAWSWHINEALWRLRVSDWIGIVAHSPNHPHAARECKRVFLLWVQSASHTELDKQRVGQVSKLHHPTKRATIHTCLESRPRHMESVSTHSRWVQLTVRATRDREVIRPGCESIG